ncbi:hypothetical protein RJ641_006290 [Dillenia turbinata]|uniref:Uncharacterized protein n=1 Tax=Dillenia turbinata TaxID=194707 RepID=A0AAN8V6M5_9MAGN
MRSIPKFSSETMTTTATEPAARPPWRSPVPYLFGGIAAMLGLIAFALLLLACSYWKLKVQDREREIESEGEKNKNRDAENRVFEEKFLVIMAGEKLPTFLATPIFPKGTCVSNIDGKRESEETGKVEKDEKNTEEQSTIDVLGTDQEVNDEAATTTLSTSSSTENMEIPDQDPYLMIINSTNLLSNS